METTTGIMSRDIILAQIDPDQEQPRQQFDATKLNELAQSIQSKGLIVPILVRPEGNRFIIVHGERRFRAVRQLGQETIRAEVRQLTAQEAQWLALLENIQRDDLSPIEEAQAYHKRLAEGITQQELAEKIGKTQSYIAQKLRLLKLPDPLQYFLNVRALSEGHARQLLRLKKIYTEQPTMKLNEIDTSTMTSCNLWGLLQAFRPEENAIYFFSSTLREPELLMQGCRAFWGYVQRQEYVIPCWVAGAFWWASVIVEGGFSVSFLSKALDRWRGRFLSNVSRLYCSSRFRPAKNNDDEVLKDPLWWAVHSDVRHTLDTSDVSGFRDLTEQAILFTMKKNYYVQPSTMQEQGFAVALNMSHDIN